MIVCTRSLWLTPAKDLLVVGVRCHRLQEQAVCSAVWEEYVRGCNVNCTILRCSAVL